DLVRELDLGPIYAHYERELRGYPPHHPQMMVALLLYAYAVGVPSSRKIERRTHEDIAFRVIAGGTHPDHTRISEFRRIHLKELEKLFVQVLQLCAKAKLVKLGHIAIDGTKIKANASKHKAMSYKRMMAEEAKLADKVRVLLEAAEAADSQEDAAYGRGVRGDELPEELRRAKDRLARIREAKAALEAEAKANHEGKKAARKKDDDDEKGGTTSASGKLPSHKVPAYAHHEKLDGSGYPRGLSGSAIPVEARMMTVADIYDALTVSDRPYKRSVPHELALSILEDEAKQGKIDAELVRIFIEAEVPRRS